MRTAAVVGAGAAGLAAAWELQHAGWHVVVLEAGAAAGGRIRSDQLDGVGFDASVQLLGSNYTRTFELAQAVGADSLLVRAPGRDAVWRNGRANPLTYGSVSSMITSAALPAALKLKLGARYLPFLARQAAGLDLHDLQQTGGVEHDRESIAAWGGRELGEDFVELLAYPLLGAYYGSTPEQTSSAVYHALARAGLDVSVYAVRGGMAMLPAAVARALLERGATFHFNTAVNRVAVERAAEVDGTRYDAVVVATPAAEAARLLDRPVAALARVQMTRTVTLALALRAPADVDFFGLSVPRIARGVSDAVALCVQERKGPGLVPPGAGAIVVLPAPQVSDALAALTPDAVLNRLLPVVDRLLPGVRANVTRARATYFEPGYTIFHPGYVRQLAAFAAVELPPHLALAGDYLVAPTVEGAIRSGVAAARRITQSVSGE